LRGGGGLIYVPDVSQRAPQAGTRRCISIAAQPSGRTNVTTGAGRLPQQRPLNPEEFAS
jgi:hypothetical protein